ncbi:RnfH family protein [Saccharospirillum sp.]|uniref:RnfH family protein n=1 Tax=Saccharospirillum sp. TaxID=2033801 RepID=UPI0034A0190A
MEMIKVEVAYAIPEKQRIIEVDVPVGTTVAEAVRQSGIEREFPDLVLDGVPVGVFGRKIPKPETEELHAGDRVELYRPLLIDPKQARLNRAAKAKQDAES